MEFVHEFIGHYVAFEGKLWKTLVLLFFKPGQLTSEYLAGRKLRYVLPLRLYLTISVLFFFLINVLPNKSVEVGTGEKAKQEIAAAREEGRKANPHKSNGDTEVLIGSDDEGNSLFSAKIDAKGEFHCSMPDWACTRIKPKLESLRTSHDQTVKQGLSSFRVKWPYAMFLLMPIFALLLKLAYLKRGMVYGEHLVFSLHVHAAWFVLVLLMVYLPETLALLAFLALPIYTVMAMRRVYGGGWLATTGNALAVALPYALATLCVVVMLVLIVALT